MSTADTLGSVGHGAHAIPGLCGFARFAQGCNHRMGQDWCPDQTIRVDLALLAYVESTIHTLEDPTELAFWSLGCALFAVCLVVSLR